MWCSELSEGFGNFRSREFFVVESVGFSSFSIFVYFFAFLVFLAVLVAIFMLWPMVKVQLGLSTNVRVRPDIWFFPDGRVCRNRHYRHVGGRERIARATGLDALHCKDRGGKEQSTA